MGKCNNYTPDIQAQGDCIQCGCAFEDHESKKEYKPLSEWAPFKVGERFVRKGYDDCRGVIVVHSANLPTFMISGWKCGGLSFFDGILYTPLDRDTVELEQAEARIDELEEMLTSATMDGYDMAKNEYRSHIKELEVKVAESEALLAKAVEALELALELADNGLVDFSKYGLSCDADINKHYRTTLAELKGQDDE
jgi:hypothetical protein